MSSTQISASDARVRIPVADPGFLADQIADYKIRAMATGSHILQGKIPGAEAIMLSTNDYLSLAHHPKINQAQAEYLLAHGRGLMRSDVFRHEMGPLQSFEEQIAKWTKMPVAALTQSGWVNL